MNALWRWFRQSAVLQLAIPMILSNITVPLLGIVDTAMMGHLPQAYYVGAVGIGTIIFDFLFWAFGFLRMSTSGLVAQAYGKGDKQAATHIVGRSFLLALLLAALILVLQTVIADIAFDLIHATPEVNHYGRVFFHVGIWMAPAIFLNYTILGWFFGQQNTRVPLLITLFSNITGIVLDLYFVLVLGMTVAGVAAATVIAQYVGLLIGLYFMRRSLAAASCRWSWRELLMPAELKKLIMLNKDIFIRTLCLMFAFGFFNYVGANEGKLILAANVVLFNFQLFMAYALEGFSIAAQALVGKAIGEGSQKKVIAAVMSAGTWAIGVALFFVLLYGLFGKSLVNAMTSITSVRAIAYQYLPWVIFLPVVSALSFLFDGVFIGATLSKQMRNTMMLSLAVFLIAYYKLNEFGNEGLWLAFTLFMFTRGISMAAVFYQRYKKGKLCALK